MSQPEHSPILTEEGCTLLYFGDGRGKTTIALGLILRALVRAWPVLLIRFPHAEAHDPEPASVRKISPQIAQKLTQVDLTQRGLRQGEKGEESNCEDECAATSAAAAMQAMAAMDAMNAMDGWEIGKRAALSGKYRLIVLDHVTEAMACGWIPLPDVAAFLATRPTGLCLALTGKQASPELIALCDSVMEMRNARRG